MAGTGTLESLSFFGEIGKHRLQLRLADSAIFFKDAALMGNQQSPAAIQWPMDKVLPMFAHPLRWKILLALAEKGPLTASALPGAGSLRGLNSVLKHLGVLRKLNWVVQIENPGDGRKFLYAVSPALPLVQTEHGPVLDFTYATFRLRQIAPNNSVKK